jgi:hypothetical protein
MRRMILVLTVSAMILEMLRTVPAGALNLMVMTMIIPVLHSVIGTGPTASLPGIHGGSTGAGGLVGVGSSSSGCALNYTFSS